MTDEEFDRVVDFAVHHAPPFGPGSRLVVEFDWPLDKIVFEPGVRDPVVRMGPGAAMDLRHRELREPGWCRR